MTEQTKMNWRDLREKIEAGDETLGNNHVKLDAIIRQKTGSRIAHYSTDINAAMTLVSLGFAKDYELTLHSHIWRWLAVIKQHASPMRSTRRTFSAYAPNPALAICYAWLEWQEANEETT